MTQTWVTSEFPFKEHLSMWHCKNQPEKVPDALQLEYSFIYFEIKLKSVNMQNNFKRIGQI